MDRDVLRVGRRRRSRRGSSLSCSLPPFTPWVVIAGCCVLRVTARFQGRALCWRLEGSQLRSESLEGSCFSLSYRVGLGRVSPTPTVDKKKKKFCHFPPRHHIRHDRHGAAIFNPPRHHYSVAFFQKSATQLRHGRHLTTLILSHLIFCMSFHVC